MVRFQISPDADQKFGMILENLRVTIRVRYNVTTERWSFDLAIDDNPVLSGIRIVTGVDMLAPFDLGLGSLFAVTTVPGALPDRDGLPNGGVRLYQASRSEIDAAILT